MSRFYNISQQEMEAFLVRRGFQKISLPNVVELVYAKIVKHEGFTMSLRIYTAINPSGESRGCGDDAIRVQLYWRYADAVVTVGKPIKVLRLRTWEKNLAAAITRFGENFRTCPGCGAPMVERKGKNGLFWGCVTWFKTQCPGRPVAREVIQRGHSVTR